jgi:oligoribonuclease
MDEVLEVAAIVTDADLQPIATFHGVIGLGPTLRMTKNVWEMHTANGLLAEIDAHDNGTSKVSRDGPNVRVRGRVSVMDSILTDFINDYAAGVPMAGSTIAFDRGFYKEHLQHAERLLHYRNFDVSVYREAMRRWAPWDTLPDKSSEHRTMSDIEYSIEVARHWKASLAVYGELVEAQAPGAMEAEHD